MVVWGLIIECIYVNQMHCIWGPDQCCPLGIFPSVDACFGDYSSGSHDIGKYNDWYDANIGKNLAGPSVLPAPCVTQWRSGQIGHVEAWILVWKFERREIRKVGQREEKRTREVGTKMQYSIWRLIPSETTFRKSNFICTLNVQTYALEIFKHFLENKLVPCLDHRWALNRNIIGFELSWNHKRLTKIFPRRELTCSTK